MIDGLSQRNFCGDVCYTAFLTHQLTSTGGNDRTYLIGSWGLCEIVYVKCLEPCLVLTLARRALTHLSECRVVP